MLCERCQKREATIQLMERTTDGVLKVHNYCETCIFEVQKADFPEGDWSSSLGKFLADILHGSEEETQNRARMSQIACPTCGMTYGEFMNQNIFGCADCYEAFGPVILSKLKQIQGADTHVGKEPRYKGSSQPTQKGSHSEELPKEEKRMLLESKLREAVSLEDYALAAKYRDELKQLPEEN